MVPVSDGLFQTIRSAACTSQSHLFVIKGQADQFFLLKLCAMCCLGQLFLAVRQSCKSQSLLCCNAQSCTVFLLNHQPTGIFVVSVFLWSNIREVVFFHRSAVNTKWIAFLAVGISFFYTSAIPAKLLTSIVKAKTETDSWQTFWQFSSWNTINSMVTTPFFSMVYRVWYAIFQSLEIGAQT